MFGLHEWQLIKHLTAREIKARYKQSFLGFLWIIFNPLFQLIILSFVFSQIVRFGNLGVPYPVFLFAGLLPWIFFDTAITHSTNTLQENAALLKQVYFPREILVAAVVIAKSFDFFISAILFILLMIFFKLTFTPYMIFFIPIFLLHALFTYGLGLLLSALNLYYRDVQYLFGLVLKLWFYLTPVIYPVEVFPQQWQFLFKLNPMSVFINAYRQVLLGGSLPNLASLGIGVIVTIALYFISHRIFKRLEGSFSDVV